MKFIVFDFTRIQKLVIFGAIVAIAAEVSVWRYRHENRNINSGENIANEKKKKTFTSRERMRAVRDEINWQFWRAFQRRDYDEEVKRGQRRRKAYDEYIREEYKKRQSK